MDMSLQNGNITATPRAATTKLRAKVRFLSPAELRPRKDAMWALVQGLIVCDRDAWYALFEETACYAIYELEGEIVGFSSVMEAELLDGRRRIWTIGLGQTVVLPAYRNQFLVQRALIYRWMRRFARRPLQPIYIWGSCVSYKSYLSFVKVLKVVYPRAGVSAPAHHQAVIDLLGRHWYADEYVPESGVVIQRNFAVADPHAQARPEDLLDSDIAYYHARVPVLEGDTAGVLTISPCIRSNFLPMVCGWVRNAVRKGLGMKRR
jgi:hypothetical protein